MPWSDIDFIVQSKNKKDLVTEFILGKIDSKFRELTGVFGEVKYIQTASVPVIKATCTAAYGLKKIDVTVQDGKHSGPNCVELVDAYLEQYQCLRYLVLPFKQLIYNSQMNDPYQGGLTSYALVLMIVSFLQMKLFNRSTIDISSPNLGLLFIEFFSWYSNFDYSQMKICPYRATTEVALPPFTQSTAENITNAIVIVDPLNSNNNVARATYKFGFLKNIFFISFFSAFSLTGCEIKDEVHHREKAENKGDWEKIRSRQHVLPKILNAGKTFNFLYSTLK